VQRSCESGVNSHEIVSIVRRQEIQSFSEGDTTATCREYFTLIAFEAVITNMDIENKADNDTGDSAELRSWQG
jgi:hypothetical protein